LIDKTVTRFAPSPTGFLHLGHAHAALFARRAAVAAGGTFLLRIEDIDGPRCRLAFEDAIFEDLTWLGLSWDGEVTRQSDRRAAYGAALAQLSAAGLTYPCFCTRKEIAAEIKAAGAAPQGPDGPLYPGTCRGARGDARARGEAGVSDAVVARKDIGTSYHLACVVDDAAQGVTLVTRGDDLLPATHLQRVLQAALSLPQPDYHHHGLVMDDSGHRLAKRDDARSLRALRASGVSPAEARAMAGFPD
jgi:glutamyl-Q tRNA(Asp) synthetase